MSIPLDLLIEENQNIYEITCAAIRRASQLTVTGEEDPEAPNAKIVSRAIDQVLSRKVEYQLEE